MSLTSGYFLLTHKDLWFIEVNGKEPEDVQDIIYNDMQ